MFEGGVHGFRRPYQHDGGDEPAPILAADIEAKAGDHDQDGGDEMEPGVVLRAQHVDDACESEAEASEPRGDREPHQCATGDGGAGARRSVLASTQPSPSWATMNL